MDNFRRRLLSQDADPKPYVDLGLSSGTLWAKGNLVKNGTEYAIGEETDFGTFVSWGNIDGHNGDEGYGFSSTNYKSTAGNSLTGNISANDADHDICLARLGAHWRLPTRMHFKELYDETYHEWTTLNGVGGIKFENKNNRSKFIFFPYTGHYIDTKLEYPDSYGDCWSSSYKDSSTAYCLEFTSGGIYIPSYKTRYRGFTVRPIYIQ